MDSMLILVLVLLFGSFAGVSGFMACFMPAHWSRLTEKISFADQWSEPSPKRQPLFLRLFVRAGQSIGGLAVCLVGFGFAYLAGSGIYHVLTGRAVHHVGLAGPVLPNNHAPAMIAFPVFMILVGALLAIFPRKALGVFERFSPTKRTVKSSAMPKVSLFLRLFGGAVVVLAILSLLH